MAQAIDRIRQFSQGLHVRDCLLRNGKLEVVLELEEEFEEPERVDPELIDRSVLVYRLRIATKLLGGEFFDPSQCIHGRWRGTRGIAFRKLSWHRGGTAYHSPPCITISTDDDTNFS